MRVAFGAEACKAAVSAALCTALVAGPPAHAYNYLEDDLVEQAVTLEQAAVKVADATYPILRSLNSESFAPFEESVANVLRGVDQADVSKTLDLGRAALQSVPADKAGGLVGYGDGLSLGTCTKVPIPSALVGALGGPARAALKPLPQGDGLICLPSQASLERTAAAIAAADPAKVNAFGAQVQEDWKAATKRAGFSQASELDGRLRKVLQGAELTERKQFKTAREAYAEASLGLDELRRKQADGPPKCYTVGCTTQFEAGILRDDELAQKGLARKRYPTNYFLY